MVYTETGVYRRDSRYRFDQIGFGGIEICQDKTSFCYGIDAVLISNFLASFEKRPANICDLGSGNGIIPFILYAKIKELKTITGIEIQKESYELAQYNSKINNLEEKINFINDNIRFICDKEKYQYLRNSFDCVISNPPYFKKGTNIINDKHNKSIARHELQGDLDDFLKCASYILKSKKYFYMINRPNRLKDILCKAPRYNLEPKTIQLIQPKENHNPNLALVAMQKNGGCNLKVLNTLVVRNKDNSFNKYIKDIYGY